MGEDDIDKMLAGIKKPGQQRAVLKALIEVLKDKAESLRRTALADRQAENERRIGIGADPLPIPRHLEEPKRRRGRGKGA